ncbi:hypothetical protein QAD02_011912 [Eretmocerus hayati]|uniref:Uncharacterized protein n=1 Tax=Eretmocerus hayati TaxID=131215 RepID=A0ACC2NZ93_9HYME|nr:hypothetical protein QAD02_011912 [Eretmocerus hayati]
MRYQLFRIKTTKLSFKLESLPPTKKAAAQHILRAYLQVQLWLGNTTITATKFGWYESNTSTQARCLKPVYVADNILIPPKLMEQISCGCKKSCTTKRCTCFKLGVPCTDLCKSCHGITCNNIRDFAVEVPSDNPNVDAEADTISNTSQSGEEFCPTGITQVQPSTLFGFHWPDDESTLNDD